MVLRIKQICCGALSLLLPQLVLAKSLPEGAILSELLSTGYSNGQKLQYDVSWTGGIKIGELHLEINRLTDEGDDVYEIRACVSTKNGPINWVYPINDLHVTKVRGPEMLPFYYEIWQQEGFHYRAHRVLQYDQEKGTINYMKNGKKEGDFTLDGVVNNEFSAFFNSRLMPLEVGRSFVVPTFADKKRVEVEVRPINRERLDETIFGPVDTIEVMPIMTFRGLYDKQGDTVIWYSDDKCRVPVLINSKIRIGSLTAELISYENPACQLYPAVSATETTRQIKK
jgi:hypothetical protein